jgi:hypothetical protein
VHDTNEPPSNRHWKLLPDFVDVNENVAEVCNVEPLGPAVIVVSGGVVSTTQVNDAGEASTLPAESTARTWNVCDALDRPAYVLGVEQAVKPPPSIWHWNVPASVDVNENDADAAFVGFTGLAVIVVSGGVRSTVHVKLAGVGSTLPTVSVATTENVCEPAANPAYAFGLLQTASAAPSRLHWNVAASVAVNEKLAPV